MRISMRTIIFSTIAVIVLGIFPVLAERDSYPHSHLPMFSVRRTEISRIDTAVGRHTDGSIVRLSPRLIADTDEVIMAKDAVVNAIRTTTTDQLCADIARRVSQRQTSSRRNDITEIEVVTETYNAVTWFQGDKEPLDIQVYAKCDVLQ
jgi:hypothetical protein